MQKVVTIVKRFLFEEKAIGIIGIEGTALAHAAAGVCEKEEIPMVIVPQPESIWKGKRFVFSGAISDMGNAKAYASLIMDYLKLDNIGIIHDAGEYGTNSTSQLLIVLKERGDKVKVVGIEKYTPESMDCTPQVMNIKSAGAKGVF